MPPQLLVDISKVDLSKVKYGPEAIRGVNAHRHEFELLHGVYDMVQQDWAVGFHQTTDKDFWVRGHIPGRPLMPGVLVVEAAGQLCSFVYRFDPVKPPEAFLGFAGLENIKWRGQITPGERLTLIVKMREERHRRIVCDVQALVGDRLVFEGAIIGMIF